MWAFTVPMAAECDVGCLSGVSGAHNAPGVIVCLLRREHCISSARWVHQMLVDTLRAGGRAKSDAGLLVSTSGFRI